MIDIAVILNGLSRAMLLFIIAAGLSLIFGLLSVVNFAHGVMYALGAYVGVMVIGVFNNFWLGLLLAPLIVAALGLLIEVSAIRPLYGRDPIYSVLLTFGITITLEEAIILIWGPTPKQFAAPEFLSGPIDLFGTFYPRYRLSVIIFGIVVGIGLWLFLERTRVGMIVRAGTLDSQMVEAMGINIRRVFTGMFAVGIGLAAMGGVVAGPIYSVYPTMGTSILIEAFIVVVIGGLGSIRGSFIGALIVGITQSLGSSYASDYTSLLLFVLMIAVLVVRPYGIFGQPGLMES